MINRELMMGRVDWENLLSIDLPETWTFHEEGGVISLFDESDGVGVLQFSFVKRMSSQHPVKEDAVLLARDCVSQRGWSVSDESIYDVSIDGCPASVFSAQETCDGEVEYWRVWHIVGERRVAFVTYNCLSSDKREEDEVCDLIVRSFRWLN